METSTLSKIKGRAAKLLEGRMLHAGTVLEVRHWQPCTMLEIDLHLPIADMAQWAENIPYIKFKVADFTFRDYTPSGWDAETCTCTIFVDAAHNGPGSLWARNLQKGDNISYIKVGVTRHCPLGTSTIIGLGDESSLGHLLALQQTVIPSGRFTGAIVMANEGHRKLLGEYFPSPLAPIARYDTYGHHSLIEWLVNQHYSLDNTLFYLAGNNTMVDQLRKLLKQQGYASGQIKAQGFWS
ncbi:siderophore-interacting protein [Mucilaginibacter polytrichastri]|uniref:Uncharacterized protein n=1 Tax=Mucilaginibacter polytrichastri TaxID=1302689 RepID=A0A1Q6A3E8_9SPHI|nr:siderophore-interacting protein [Mucilaginibacter polytrichastri]OKS88532.1 hypothetical protein RG47T_4001 [Mucilaginibacter polytrichastri]SFT11793.1 NADPH-dependent ferric siderophore reductase, contains FAD-binding and SIP domains [Mucilaginibacter polytrichastri]